MTHAYMLALLWLAAPSAAEAVGADTPAAVELEKSGVNNPGNSNLEDAANNEQSADAPPPSSYDMMRRENGEAHGTPTH